MRLGVVTTSFPRFQGDPAGCFVLELCLALSRLGHEVEVLAPDPGCGEPPAWPGVGVRWCRYAHPRSGQRLAYGAGIPDNVRRQPSLALQAPALTAALAAATARRAHLWSGVVSHWLVPSGLAVSLTTGLPQVALAHSGDVWLLRRMPGGARVLRQITSRASAVAAVNPTLVRQLEELDGAAPIELLPLGPAEARAPDPAERRRLALELSAAAISPQALVVAVVARLVPIKGVDVLLRALGALKGVAAVIAGDGPERRTLEGLAARLGARALFLGQIDGDRRAALLERAQVVAIPSRELPSGRCEGTPLAAIEAMSAGIPLVASATGGLPWAVGGAALLVPPSDPEALAAALRRLRDDPTARLELSRRGRERARDFGWSRAARRLESLLSRGHNRPPPAREMS